MGSLVKYYYSWKKTRTRTSLMDRQARKLGGVKEETSELGSEQGSNTDSESEEKVCKNTFISLTISFTRNFSSIYLIHIYIIPLKIIITH